MFVIKSNERAYKKNDVIHFSKTKEAYGGLSNMAAGNHITIQGVKFLTSEALYQAMRFPDHPEVQKVIIEAKSPMTAKMICKEHIHLTRADWDAVKIVIMRWCLGVKLIQNWDKFGALLLSTQDKSIVELSYKDSFWGAKPSGTKLVGTNALGRLLMELRGELDEYVGKKELSPPPVDNFRLFGEEIGPVKFENTSLSVETVETLIA